MNTRKVRLWLGIILVVVLVSFGLLGARRWANRQPTPPRESRFVAGPAARLVEEVTYETCGHVEKKEKPFPSSQRGLGLDDLTALYPAWDVTASDDNLVLKATRPGLCPLCREKLFVGLDGEEVVVFYGTPEGPHEIKERTGISTGGLPEEALLDLRTGIAIENKEQLSQVLEGLMN
jgi:hypothetical protein